MNIIRLLSTTVRRPALCKIFSVNYASQSQNPVRYLETQDRWREKDGISRRYQMIYKAPMEKSLNYATGYLTFSTATVSILGAYYAAFIFDISQIDTPVVLGDDVVIANSGTECFAYLAAFIMFHVAVKVLLSKYVLRLYQDGDSYIAVFRGHFFNTIKKHEFKLNDVKKLKPTLVVTWGDTRFALGNKHAILLENYFKTPEYYNHLVYKDEKPSEDD